MRRVEELRFFVVRKVEVEVGESAKLSEGAATEGVSQAAVCTHVKSSARANERINR
jgi:hypothetical protein